jgi:hypothetical protein
MGVVILTPDSGAQPRGRVGSGLQIISRKPIAFRCRCCSKAFYEDEQRQWIAHVTACFHRNEEQIREENDLGHQMPGLFGPEAGDVEKKDYYRERKGWKV